MDSNTITIIEMILMFSKHLYIKSNLPHHLILTLKEICLIGLVRLISEATLQKPDSIDP